MRWTAVTMAAGLLSAASAASAATIVWQAPATVATPADVVTTGTLFAAISANDASVAVNGVTFAGFGDAPGSLEATGLTRQSGFGFPILGSDAYDELLNSAAYAAGPASDAIHIHGLTVGRQYAVQIWEPFWNVNWATAFVAGDTSAAVEAAGYTDYGTGTPSLPEFVVGRFTADGTDQSIGMTNVASYSMLGAIQVRDVTATVPEPAAWALLIAGFGAVGAAQRRDRAGSVGAECGAAGTAHGSA